MPATAAAHSNEHIRSRIHARAGQPTWTQAPATPVDTDTDGYIDYSVWGANWTDALEDRGVDCARLPAAVTDTLLAHWPESYSFTDTWDIDGGPHMDRLAAILTDFGFGPGPGRNAHVADNAHAAEQA